MPRKKCYGSEAEKQKAYRLRKQGSVKKEPVVKTTDLGTDGDNLPVPVLAEMGGVDLSHRDSPSEARESTTFVERLKGEIPTTGCFQKMDSRGGQKKLSGGEKSLGESGGIKTLEETETDSGFEAQRPSSIRDTAQNLSKTDQLFDADRPGWYIFGKETKEGSCWECGKKYSTRLEMSRFCSPKCKNQYLGAHFAKKSTPES